jgi:hypothetical protein
MNHSPPIFVNNGPAVQHNQACAVYFNHEAAVYDLDIAVFQPSWAAQARGWKLVRAENWFQRLLIRLFFRT